MFYQIAGEVLLKVFSSFWSILVFSPILNDVSSFRVLVTLIFCR
jgi:hypothetical protein